MMRSKFSLPQWSLLERLVAQGGAMPVEYRRFAEVRPNSWEWRAGPFAGLGATVEALERRGCILRSWHVHRSGVHREVVEITDHGRAMLAEHQARRKRRGAA